MKLNVSFSPDIVAPMRAEVATGRKAVSMTMAQAGASHKLAWLVQITGVGLGAPRYWDRGSRAACPFSPPPAPHRQAFFFVKTIQFLLVHHKAVSFKHHPDPTVAKPAALLGDLMPLLAKLPMIWRLSRDTVMGSTPTRSQSRRREIFVACSCGPIAFTGSIPHRLECRFPPLSRCRQRCPSKSFSTTTSSIVSATRRLSFAFSASSCFKRPASETSIPPYLAFSL